VGHFQLERADQIGDWDESEGLRWSRASTSSLLANTKTDVGGHAWPQFELGLSTSMTAS